jgi:glutamate synthase (ferredoxin)
MTGGRAIIIGKTGRNFAAGMSGGLAFVLDEAGDFARRVNHDMVSLEALEHPEDVQFVQEMLSRHARYTESTVAARLLADWEKAQPLFVKVIPNDYKRVLGAMKKAEEAGIPVEEAVMAGAHG